MTKKQHRQPWDPTKSGPKVGERLAKKLNLRPSHRAAWDQLEAVKDIEHFRVRDLWQPEKSEDQVNFYTENFYGPTYTHYAVVVLPDGTCYVGNAQCAFVDQYNHKIGYEISLGRALDAAANTPDAFAFHIDSALEGRDLYLEIRRQFPIEISRTSSFLWPPRLTRAILTEYDDTESVGAAHD